MVGGVANRIADQLEDGEEVGPGLGFRMERPVPHSWSSDSSDSVS